jgi:hypothetical protein
LWTALKRERAERKTFSRERISLDQPIKQGIVEGFRKSEFIVRLPGQFTNLDGLDQILYP